MWEVLLAACLISDPTDCATERRPGGETYNACVVAAEAMTVAEGRAKQAWPCVAEGETPDMALTEVAPGVLVHKAVHGLIGPENGGDIANIAAVVGEDAVAVIDAGSTAGVAGRFLAALGAHTDKPMDWLILTHMHPDHTLGAGVFRDAGATVVAHANLPRALSARARSYLDAGARALGAEMDGAAAVMPDATVADRRVIDLGGRRLLLEAHPVGHTDNDLTVTDDATEVLFAGDLVFLGHLPTLDGSLRGWLGVLDDLTARHASRVVMGHGPAAAPWPEAAAPTRAYLEGLAEAARAAIAAGEPILAATRAMARDVPPGWALADRFAERNATAAFRELEWE